MGMFDLKGNSGGNGWNYAHPDQQGYMEMIEGTIVEISNPQCLNFSTKQPEFWPDGNPKRNLQVVLLGRSGKELSWTFAPKSKAAEACLVALDPQGTRTQVSIEELLGKFVRIQTQAGVYNAQNPRPWWVTVIGEGEANKVRGLKDLSQPSAMPGMPAPQQAPVQQTPPPPVQQAPAPTAFQQAQQAAQQAVAQNNFQQTPAVAPMNPAEEYYSDDIPF